MKEQGTRVPEISTRDDDEEESQVGVGVLPSGAWPVMVTPFKEDRSIDWSALDELTEWYLGTGIAGLFAVAQTSEMYALSASERLAVARRVVDRVAGRIPVVATGTFGATPDEQADAVRAMADTGVDAVIAVTSQVAEQADGDQVLLERLEHLRAATGATLGLYECPQPYKRLLATEVLSALAAVGGFVFLKETSERPDVVAAKAAAVAGSTLKVYNAEMSGLLESVRAGAHGFCGNAGNYYPELVQWICDAGSQGDPGAERIQRIMTVVDAVVSTPLYPASAKYFLASARGVRMSPICRAANIGLGEHDRRLLDHLARTMRELELPVALV